MSERITVESKKYTNCIVFKHTNRRVVVFTPNDDNLTKIVLVRLHVITDEKERKFLEGRQKGLDTTVNIRPHSKYATIETRIVLSHPTLECLFFGFSKNIDLLLEKETENLQD